MNDIEDRLRTAFETQAATVRPTPDAATENQRRVRRSDRRRRALIACTVTSALVIAPLVALTTGKGTTHRARPALGASSSLVEAVGDPKDLTGPPPPFAIRDTAPTPAMPVALAPDGSVMALLGRKLWLLGPSRGDGLRSAPVPEPTSLERPDVKQAVAYGTSTQARVLVDARGEMTCVDASGKRTTSYASNASGVWTDGVSAVVRLRSGAVQVSGRCPAQKVAEDRSKSGYDALRLDGATPVALWGTRLTAVNNRGEVLQYDLTSGPPTKAETRPLPISDSIRLDDGGAPLLYSAANATTAVWVNGRSLSTVKAGHNAVTSYVRLPEALDVGKGGQLTLGRDVVAFTVTDALGRVGSFVYDLRTGRRITWPGRVLAAGDWLVWQDGKDMNLAKVR
ncbi:hypothetical protein [Actinomadura oligospora]|uniref:hypothetical protein n=1 Tax=Actinomadura oligospora TaxID=111804 RepID=UPI00047C0BF6|nr:hypothetical protein [Actinomadura oligospora]